MSITASTTCTPLDVTAAIEVTRLGTAYLRVTVDGEPIAFEISPHTLRLRKMTVTAEAARLLQRHAGYQPSSEWTPDDHGHLTATVAQMTGRCITCVHGCGCEIGSTGCGHYQCPAASAAVANTCDGAALALDAKRTYPRTLRPNRRRSTR